jgi:DNA ligase-associated metallophosphoesterase
MKKRIKNYHTVTHQWKGEDWVLHPLKGMFWVGENRLLITDLHLGKTRHFQRSGIYLPEGSDAATLDSLEVMMTTFSPAEVWILGDLFHSHFEKRAWDRFAGWLDRFTHISWCLVLGNHDIIQKGYYEAIGMSCFQRFQAKPGMELVHRPDEAMETGVTLAGHIHPGIELHGRGRQRLVLPCFYFTDRLCMLPALGRFTGLSRIQPQTPSEEVFVTTSDKVIPIPSLRPEDPYDKS